MSDQNIPPVVDTDAASGSNEPGEEKRPSYESYQNLLGEKKREQDKAKNLEDELRTLQDDKKVEETKRLEDQSKFKELYGKTKEDLEAKDKKIADMLKERVDARKMHSFLDAIKADVPRQYWGLIDLDKIAMEGDKVDEFSIQKYVEEFRANFTHVIQPIENRRMPNDSPSAGGSATLTMEAWSKLPLKEKEAKMHLVKMG